MPSEWKKMDSLFCQSPVWSYIVRPVKVMLETVDCSPKTLKCSGQAKKANQYTRKYPVSRPSQCKNFNWLFYHSPVSFHLIRHVKMMLETVDCSPKTLTCPCQAEKANQYAHKYPVSMPFQGKNFSGLCYNSPVSFHLIRHVKVM